MSILCAPTIQDIVDNQMGDASWKALWTVNQHDWNERWEESVISILGISVPDLIATQLPKGKREGFALEMYTVNFLPGPSPPLLLQALPEVQSFHKFSLSRAQRQSQAALAAMICSMWAAECRFKCTHTDWLQGHCQYRYYSWFQESIPSMLEQEGYSSSSPRFPAFPQPPPSNC